jgi:asparagine synthase (glutamine-hydrolysing)
LSSHLNLKHSVSTHTGPVPYQKISLAAYFRFGYVPAPHSIYENVKKLEPGTVIVIDGRPPYKILDKKVYWHLPSDALHILNNRSDAYYLKCLHELLLDAVQLQMIADVPLGAFLSSGIDSSLIVSIMQSLSSRKIQTFSVGFESLTHNEAPDAQRIAKRPTKNPCFVEQF